MTVRLGALILGPVKFHWFHLMPWPYLPEDFPERHRSVWVDIPPQLYDPVRGHDVYHTYLDQLKFAGECGFDGICVNEHHQNGYGLMPSPNLMAATLARETSGAKIVVMGNSVALYNPPTRVAEEMAMLDVLSGGRLVAGFPVGTSMDSAFAYGQNPATLREKYRESVDLILRAWKAEEPFPFNGKYTKLRYVNPWPRPIQKPHPPVWVPGGGSSVETWEWCARQGFMYSNLSYFGYLRAIKTIKGFWETIERLGLEPNPYRVGFLQFVAVADDDAHAERLYAEAADYFYHRCLHFPPAYRDAPGYTSIASIRSALGSSMSAAMAAQDQRLSWKDFVERGYIVAGSPDTVVDRLNHMADEMRIGHLLVLCHFGNMPDEVVRYNTQRFGQEVIPRLRSRFDDWEDHWWPADPPAALSDRSPRAAVGAG